MNKHIHIGRAVIMLAILAFYGCDMIGPGFDGTGTGHIEKENGTISIWLTDAPFPSEIVDQVTIKVVKVEIRLYGDTLDNPYLEIMNDTVTYDLLKLRNGKMAQVSEKEIPAGEYDQIRLYIDQASIHYEGTKASVVKIPSGPSSGIKIFPKPRIPVLEGEVTDVLIDFDVSNSFIVKGNPETAAGIKGFNFKPVIRAVVADSTGIVSGVVTDSESRPVKSADVWITADSVITTAITDTKGNYLLPGIPGGTYNVLSATKGYDTMIREKVVVDPGSEVRLDIQLDPLY